MEGDKVTDHGSFCVGKRMKNGWKFSGSPWTKVINPKLIWLTRRQEVPFSSMLSCISRNLKTSVLQFSNVIAG